MMLRFPQVSDMFAPLYADGDLQVTASVLHGINLLVALIATPVLSVLFNVERGRLQARANAVHPGLSLSGRGLLLGPASVRRLHLQELCHADTWRGSRERTVTILTGLVVIKQLAKVRFHGLADCQPTLAMALLVFCMRSCAHAMRRRLRWNDQLWYWRMNILQTLVIWTCEHVLAGGASEVCLARLTTGPNLAGTMARSMLATVSCNLWLPVGLHYLAPMQLAWAACYLARAIQGFRGPLAAAGEVDWFWAAGLRRQVQHVMVAHLLPVYAVSLLVYALRFRMHCGQVRVCLHRRAGLIRAAVHRAPA
eukprot:jgi/Tetstr1/427056/TSEL_017261.t1